MDFLKFRRKEFERRNTRLQQSQPMELKKTKVKKKKLNIVYVMTWTGICGGSKIILQHCNELVERGHKATIVCHFPRPSWFPLNENVTFIQVPFDKVLCESIPCCDVIVATYWKEIYECMEQNIAPVVYFEQGDTHLFEPDSINVNTMEHIRKQIQIAPFVYTVSSFAKEKLKKNFDVEAEVIPNAINKKNFYSSSAGTKHENKTVITAIGSENVKFKCIVNIVVAVTLLKKLGYNIEFIWISPDTPGQLKAIPALINPSQNEIGDCLRRSDIYVCASLYESFCLPVLEAMACGATVVTTDNGGIRDFAKDKLNALIIKKNNVADMVDKIEMLINDTGLRQSLSSEALKASEEFDWSQTMDRLINYYRNIAKYCVV